MIITNIKQILENIEEINEDDSLKYKIINSNYVVFKYGTRYFIIKNTEKIELFHNTLKEIWYNLKSNVLDKIYYGYFVKIFQDFIIEAYINKHTITESDITKFKNSFCSLPMNSYTFITPLYGFCLKQANTAIQIGNFTICDFSYYQNTFMIEKKITNDINIFEVPKTQIENCFVIHKNIKAIDKTKAKFIFFDKVEQFINAMIYCCSYCTEDNANISYIDKNAKINYIVFVNNNTKYELSLNNVSLINPLYDLSSEFFEINNFISIFENIDKDKEELPELKQRIKMSIDWLGQSMRNNNLHQKYTFLCIALETLLSNKPRGTMEQGTTYRLREYSAFLAYDIPAKRKEVYNRLNNLYELRSEISHSGHAKNITIKDYYDLLDIVYLVIKKIRMLISENFYSCKHLTDYINTLKGLAD